MAPHDHLELWQKILLGIFCFPLLPFYLCAYCLCLKDEKKEKDVEGHNNATGHIDDTKNVQSNIRLSFRNRDHKNDPEEKSIKLSFRNKGFQTDDEENKQGKRSLDVDHKENDTSVLQERKKHKFKSAATFNYPWDRSNLKSLNIDLKIFEKLDDFAKKLDARATVEELVKELTHDAKTDLEKTRVIWMWLCHHIEYDIQGYANKALRSSDPDVVLRTRKAVCAGYASLFQHMCSAAGVECKQINGYAKGAGYKVGQNINGDTNHAWNMVSIEGTWHLLDATWGAGKSDDNITKFTFQYSEFYFLTHPAIFIKDHFPEQSECQLLEPWVSLKQFEKSVYVRSDFYLLDIISFQPETAVIETAKGKASVVIESCQNMLFTFNLNDTEKSGVLTLLDNGMRLNVYPQQTGQHLLQIFARRKDSEEQFQLIMDYSIYCSFVDTSMKIPKCLNNPVGPSWISQKAGLLSPSHPDPVIYTEDGCCTISFNTDRVKNIIVNLKSDNTDVIPNHVLQCMQKHKVEFNVRLPHAGSYVLLIFDEPDSYICNYLLICSNPNVKWPSYPSSLCNPVGPTLKTEKAGLLQPSHPDPVIYTEDGCCTINFRTEKLLDIIINLKCDDTQTISNHVIQNAQKHKVEVYIRLPHAGSYVLLIFDKPNGYICNYLIICSNPKVKWPPFPSALYNPVGPTSKTEKAGLMQPSHPDPVIHTDDGCCSVSFVLNQEISLHCTLHSDEIQMTKEMKSRHIFKKQSKDKVELKVRLPQSGSYVLQIFSKPVKSNSEEYSYICNYLIISTNTTMRWPVFPLTYSNWEKHFGLVQPLEGVLPKNSDVSFKLQITGVTAVCVDGTSYIPLTLADNGYWEGTCSTFGRQKLTVMIKYINEPNTWHYVLEYKVDEH